MKNIAIITGASQGIGKSTAAFFLKEHWQVINISRRPCDLAGVKNVAIDLSNSNWINTEQAKLLALLPEQHKICLVHNAATYHKDNSAAIDAEQLRTMLEVNVVAATQLNKILLPKMAQGSSIIYIGSTLSEKAVANAASYAICKHAVVGMMRATCQDLTEGTIHTCCICPGFVATEMMHQHQKNNPEMVETIKKRVSANRLIEPQEIASLVYYCANNPVINGSVLHAHLGQIEH
jgi:3-oxoacyl-[acyl-carrier protein] reductase